MKKEFIKGKWYKGSDDHYMKFDRKVESGGYVSLYSTEQVRYGEYHCVEDYWANIDFERVALEYGPLSATELAGILPESHPDRTTDYYEIY